MSEKVNHFFKLRLSVLVNGTRNSCQWMGTQQCGLPLLPAENEGNLIFSCCVCFP